MNWPEGFRFGASTCATCVEGAVLDGGRQPSTWDWFARRPGAIHDGSTPDRAAEHLRHLETDLDLVADLGVDAYRTSLSWSRVLPLGHGTENSAGLDVYDRLVDRLLERDLEPWLCLHQGDLPIALQERGGWTNRETTHWFVEYTAAVLRRLGDRLDRLVLLGAPNALAIRGHLTGEQAPGMRSREAWAAAQHHLNIAAVLAVDAARQLRPNLLLGIELELDGRRPWRDEVDDHHATQRYRDLWQQATLRALRSGTYPDHLSAAFLPYQSDDDAALLADTSFDLLGVRHATCRRIGPPSAAADESAFGYRVRPPSAGTPSTLLGTEPTVGGLVELLHDVHEQTTSIATDRPAGDNTARESNGPDVEPTAEADSSRDRMTRLYVLATGGAWADRPETPRDDRARTAYVDRHLDAAAEALEQELPLCGWFYEPLLDGFQWQHGLSARSGLVQVDFETGRRQPRDSYAWWARWLRERAHR